MGRGREEFVPLVESLVAVWLAKERAVILSFGLMPVEPSHYVITFALFSLFSASVDFETVAAGGKMSSLLRAAG